VDGRGADLSWSNLGKAILVRAKFQGANFVGADHSRAVFDEVSLQGAIFE
jgi:uncharacterized protein YjbI with pentapeptide repeats